ncbi:MAG TPA: efflux transporter periplasmic adaptor subunit, partial [Planctomycetaceae bacterium]|nr:efflux transporter periplasmic adaptor subunit [Planctomycetaceae bacterium]
MRPSAARLRASSNNAVALISSASLASGNGGSSVSRSPGSGGARTGSSSGSGVGSGVG